MNQIPYEERCKVYTNALITYGDQKQMVKCLEELAECQYMDAKVQRLDDNLRKGGGSHAR